MIEVPRLVVGAVQGRSGKTTFTLGLLKALRERGYRVQPFKKGPDYIDPSWMTFASGRECRNLDAFMMTREQINRTFLEHSLGNDISIVEGAMGLFDGLDVEGSNSTAELAHIIQAPVILVVNCQRITRSVAALINGVVNFDSRITVGGVILNHVARPRHQNIMTESIKKYCNVPVIGMLPKSKDIEIPDRHLGLIPAVEQDMLLERVDKLGKLVGENIDLELLLKIAGQAVALADLPAAAPKALEGTRPKIGVIKDRAFSFYYPENLEALAAQGAELVFVDSMATARLPKVDGLYIGGGFPEMMPAEISANTTLRQDIFSLAAQGLPIYAECGGLMYLTKGIVADGVTYPMVGVFDCLVQMEKKPQGHGYAIQEALPGNPYYPPGCMLKGHEFHNSSLIHLSEQQQYGFLTKRGRGIQGGKDALISGNVLATYHHLHASSVEFWAKSLVEKARDYHLQHK